MNTFIKFVVAVFCCLFLSSLQSCGTAAWRVVKGMTAAESPKDKAERWDTRTNDAVAEADKESDYSNKKRESEKADQQLADWKKIDANRAETVEAQSTAWKAKIAYVQAAVDQYRLISYKADFEQQLMSSEGPKNADQLQKVWEDRVGKSRKDLDTAAIAYGTMLNEADIDFLAKNKVSIDLSESTKKSSPTGPEFLPFKEPERAKAMASKPASSPAAQPAPVAPPATSPAPAPVNNVTQPATTPATNPQPVPAVAAKSEGSAPTEAPATATPPVAAPAQNNTAATGNTPVAATAGTTAPETQPAGETPAAGDTKEKTDKKVNESLAASMPGTKADAPPPSSGSSDFGWVWWLGGCALLGVAIYLYIRRPARPVVQANANVACPERLAAAQ